MPNNRDDFTKNTKDRMAKRVGYRCSNPNCRKLTCGAAEAPDDYVNIGVAAHICAAAPGGKRYDQHMTTSQRESILNGIWLCQTCAKLVDSDAKRYTVELLHKWKYDAETDTARQLENQASIRQEVPYTVTLNEEINDLLSMMERVHQKLDAAKQDENVFMTQAYEKRLESLMLLYTSLNNQLREIVSDNGTSGSRVMKLEHQSERLPKSYRRSRGAAASLAAGAAMVIQGIANTGVCGTLAMLAGSVALGWGISELLADKQTAVQISDINSRIESDVNKDNLLVRVQVMRTMIGGLESEVEKLHMDRIEYERGLVESNDKADCGK